MKQKDNQAIWRFLPLLPLLLLSGCTFAEKAGQSIQNYWLEETGDAHHYKKPKNLFYSNNPMDYVATDGTPIAIPAKESYDFYLSPFAPTTGYIECRQPEGTKIIDPYSGKVLVLGKRKYIGEKELPNSAQ